MNRPRVVGHPDAMFASGILGAVYLSEVMRSEQLTWDSWSYAEDKK